MTDRTEAQRREMLAEMPTELQERADAGEEVWDTAALREAFEVLGFMAPFVVVRRKADGVRGSLKFTHSPRFYFGFEEDE